MPDRPDVVIVGAGLVGASCAYHAARAGLAVTVLDRRGITGGTSSSGEGNIVVSDRVPGPELTLTRLSLDRWRALADELDPAAIEFEAKGGLVVADSADGLQALHTLAASQREYGVESEEVPAAHLPAYEPHLAGDLAGGVAYAQDCQVQPMLATAALLARARERRATVRTGVEVTGLRRTRDGRIAEVITSTGRIPTANVVNAAGPWAGDLARAFETPVPVEPRRGFVLVTEPLPRVIRHKVYRADYVAAVGSSARDLQVSPVVEGTRSGTVLIGSSRERVGFDRTVSVPVLRRIAAAATQLFPMLARVSAIRAYRGFRPYSPDHLPIIGPDPRAPGLWHATGHEGAGIALSAATGHLIGQLLTGKTPDLDLAPFRPERFGEAAVVDGGRES